MRILRRGLLVLGLAGAVAYAASLAVLLVAPQSVATSARGFVVDRMEVELREQMGARAAELGTLNDKLGAMKGIYVQRILGSAETLRLIVDAWVAAEPDARLRQLGETLSDSIPAAAAKLNHRIAGQIDRVIAGAFERVFTPLLRELRIHAVVNILACLMALIAAYWGTNRPRLLWVSGVLLVSTGLCAYGYAFHQNWLLNILLSDFAGWGYAGWIGALTIWVLWETASLGFARPE